MQSIDLVELPLWYDVDDAATLAVLEDELLHDIRPQLRNESTDIRQTSTREYLAARTALREDNA